MVNFSERIGLVAPRSIVQLDHMDTPLATGLWNVIYTDVFNQDGFGDWEMTRLCSSLWQELFMEPIDQMPGGWATLFQSIRHRYFKASWNRKYDILEHVALFKDSDLLQDRLNVQLERHLSGYRMIGRRFVPIADPIEVDEIEVALAGMAGTASTHLAAALKHLADRNAPDFRNSMKESISAVEAQIKEATGNPSASFTDGLRLLDQLGQLHPAMRAGLDKFYAYSSDAHGIRHAMKDQTAPDFADAKLFLTLCSAFVNHLRLKVAQTATP